MNRTSTNVPLWQVDCENFRLVGLEFELRDVSAPEHEAFVEEFCARNQIPVTRDGSTIRFKPPQKEAFVFSPASLPPRVASPKQNRE